MAERLAHRVTILGAEARLVRELKATLQRPEGPPRFAVVSQSSLQGLDPCECELLIVDFDGQVNQSLELLTQCRALYPHLPALVLVEHGDTPTAVAAMKAGAADCLEKPLAPERLWSTLTTLLGHGQAADPRPYGALTRAEVRVLHLLLAGKTNLEIATQFHRSRRTIEVHRRNLMRKLGASHISDLVKQAFRLHLLQGESPDPASLR